MWLQKIKIQLVINIFELLLFQILCGYRTNQVCQKYSHDKRFLFCLRANSGKQIKVQLLHGYTVYIYMDLSISSYVNTFLSMSIHDMWVLLLTKAFLVVGWQKSILIDTFSFQSIVGVIPSRYWTAKMFVYVVLLHFYELDQVIISGNITQ